MAAPRLGLALGERRRPVRVVDVRHLEQPPLALDPAQFVDAAIGEAEACAADEVTDAAGDEDLAGSRQGHRAGRGVDVDAAELPLEDLALAEVDCRADLDAEVAESVGSRRSEVDCRGGRVEAGEYAVAGGVELTAVVFA